MDKITKYQQSIIELLEVYRENSYANSPDEIRKFPIIDTQNNHYQLLSMGWNGQKHCFSVLFHFDIINNKIWLQQNETEWLLADELVKRGIAKDDIVLGFIPSMMRPYTGFAVA